MLFVSPVTWSHYYAELLLPVLLLTCVATGDVKGPLPRRSAIALISVMLLVAVLHEVFTTAQIHGAILLNGMIVFGSCCYWLWRTDRPVADDLRTEDQNRVFALHVVEMAPAVSRD